MRIKSEIWVKAHVRRCIAEGVAAYIVTQGDPSAGAIYIQVDDLSGGHWLFGPAPAGLAETSDERRWAGCFEAMPVNENEVDTYLRGQRRVDPDIWVIALEDRQARHFLDDQLIAPSG